MKSKMKFHLMILILSAFTSLYGQNKYNANWCFGRRAGINFSDTSNLVTFMTQAINHEATASISDKDGKLHFYTNSNSTFSQDINYCQILNSNHQIIANGDSIKVSNSATNGLLILNAPGFDNRFYLFHTFVYYIPPFPPFNIGQNLLYSIIEADSNGSWAVTTKNQLLLNDVEERLSAVKDINGTDWWILAHSITTCSNRFYKIKLTAAGIVDTSAQDIGSLHCANYSFQGEMKFSAQGDKLFSTIFGEFKIDLFDFDRCSGNLSNPRTINAASVDGFPYSGEFSLSGNMLYVLFSTIANARVRLYQYIANDTSHVGTEIWFYGSRLVGGQLERAPDNKIYLTNLPENNNYQAYHYLGVINHADSLGFACDFQPFSFFIGDSSYVSFGLPNFPNYNLGPINIYAADAGDDTVLICLDQTSSKTLGTSQVEHILYSWSPSLGLSDTAIAQPIASPTTNTWYYLTVTDTTNSSCASTRTDSVFVKVDSCVTGIAKPEQSAIMVYPNPTTDNLTIEGLKHPATFQLYDLFGREVLTAQLATGKNQIETKNMSNGIYIYRVRGETKVGKIFIEK